MQRLGLEYSGGDAEQRSSAVVQYYRGVALLWAGYPSTRSRRSSAAKKLGREHDRSRARPTTSSTRASSSRPPAPSYPVFMPLDAEPAARAGLAPAGAGPPDLGRAALPARGAAAARTTSRRRSRGGRAVRRGQPDARRSRTSARSPQRFPKSQLVHYYLGLLLAWTAQAQRRDRRSSRRRSSSARRPCSASRRRQFLERHRRGGSASLAELSAVRCRSVRSCCRQFRRCDERDAGVGEDESGTVVFEEELEERRADASRTTSELGRAPSRPAELTPSSTSPSSRSRSSSRSRPTRCSSSSRTSARSTC